MDSPLARKQPAGRPLPGGDERDECLAGGRAHARLGMAWGRRWDGVAFHGEQGVSAALEREAGGQTGLPAQTCSRETAHAALKRSTCSLDLFRI